MSAIVTGHSRGLGAAIAAALLERDIPVVGISRGQNASLARQFGASLSEIRLDLADTSATTHWFASGELSRRLREARRPILVNNAGLLQPIGPLQLQEPSDVLAAVTVNVGAALALSAAFVRATADADERRLLHISSGAGRKPYAGWSVYCATKAAIDHHARSVELDRTPRLRICSLAPGVVDTDMQAEIRNTSDERFPDRPRFVDMHREGALKDAATTGRRVVDFLLAAEFGAEVIAELPR